MISDKFLFLIYIFLYMYSIGYKLTKGTRKIKEYIKNLSNKIFGENNLDKVAFPLFLLLTPLIIYRGINLLFIKFIQMNQESCFIDSGLFELQGEQIYKLLKALESKNTNDINQILLEIKNTQTSDIYKRICKCTLSYEIMKYKYIIQNSIDLDPSDEDTLNIYCNIHFTCRSNKKNCRKFSLYYHPDKNGSEKDFQIYNNIYEMFSTIYNLV